MKARMVQLADIVESAEPGFASGEDLDDGVVQVRMHNVTKQGTLDWSSLRRVPAEDRKLRKYALQAGDVVFNSTNSPELVGKTALFTGFREPVVFSNHFLRLRLKRQTAEPGFVAWWLTHRWQQRQFENLCARWVNQASVRKDDLLALPLNLPPLPEQKRIAGLLEQADRLRRTRRYALELSDTFLPAAFLQLFGDPRSLLRRWPRQLFGELVHNNFRNGLSPSKGGKVEAKVLTLSAITGQDFAPLCLKVAPFVSTPPDEKRVSRDDFLICRGNGNLGLVGTGKFPPTDMSDVVFPDTIIAARIPTHSISRLFLQEVWKTPEIRAQIEAAARTTNGTFKINQEALGEIAVPLPPTPLQHHFAALVAQHERLRANQREALRQAEHLFQSLLHRAFTTEP